MFNLFSRKWKAACLLGAMLLTGALYTCAQVRIIAEFGGSSNKKLIGGASIGYDFKYAQIKSGFLSSGAQSGVYHGITAGPSYAGFSLYSGVYRLSYGHNSSVDRYVHNGTVQVLGTNNKIDSWSYPIGVQFHNKAFYVNAGYMVGVVKFIYCNVGMSYLFR